jgi:hypothetical protein
MRRFLSLALAMASFATSPLSAQGWTLNTAYEQLALNPRDPYLQYVVLQLARRDGRADEYARRIRSLRPGDGRRGGRQVDLFDLFTGALAVQESLQLDTMRARPAAKPSMEDVDVSTLQGPTVTSHPWKEMLGSHEPKLSPLSGMVPEDFYLVEFRSVSKLLSILESGDLWAVHLFQQVAHDATSYDGAGRIRRQLAIETTRLLRPFYDRFVDEIGACGSDLYLREGSDMTLLFRLSQPLLFQARMNQFLATALKTNKGAVREDGKLLDVPFVHVRTPDRSVHVFSAYPRKNLHVRSNSKAALARVLAAIAGKGEDGKPVKRLADTDEFRYIRHLLPYQAPEEDGFIYLSDPFIRRIVGPTVKLTEQRRMVCYNHLRMIGHAALLYRSEQGENAKSLAALDETRCTPGSFGAGRLACPDGGKYRLGASGLCGVCSHHGTADALRPGIEIPVRRVSTGEATGYRSFVTEYSRYWRQFFDPIAIRLRVTPKSYRIETLVLPLIDNSVYTMLAETLGGPPEPLEATPVPTTNIFTVAFKLDKERLVGSGVGEFLSGMQGRRSGAIEPEETMSFLEKGVGNQVALNVCDARPMFDFSLPSFMGRAFGSFNRNPLQDEALWISFLVTSLNAPVYLSIPVVDAKIVDGFLAKLERDLVKLPHARGRNWWDPEFDTYRLPDRNGCVIRSTSIGFGPVKWRLFWARIGDGLYIASKKSVLDSIMGARPVANGPKGHTMIRIRPKHWARVLTDFQLGWAENNRLACLNNVGPITGVARSLGSVQADSILSTACEIHGASLFCPEGGDYKWAANARVITCSVHGTPAAPRQPVAPSLDSDLGRLLARFKGLTATLTFLPEGLRAVVEIEHSGLIGGR